MGLPHGPQPGKIEESIGAKEANEFAVMIDTFKPLNLAKQCIDIDDNDYPILGPTNDLYLLKNLLKLTN